MAAIVTRKEVNALPSTLSANTIYFVRTGLGFDLYVTDSSGLVAYKANQSDSQVFLSDFIDQTTMAGIIAGTYTGSVHTQVQAALDYCKTSHKTLIVNPYKYYFTQGVTYDFGSHTIIGYGAQWNFSQMTSGVAISVTTPMNFYPLWDAATYAIQGLNIKGVTYGQTIPTTTTGISFGNGISNSGAHASVQNCAISGFGYGCVWSDHSYIQKIDSCSIHFCGVALRYAGTLLQDSGERIGLTNCVIFNSPTLVWATSGDFTFSNCSFDYFTQEAIIADQGSSVHLDGCHIETQNTPNLKPWLVARDSHSRICLANTRIVVNEPVSVYIGVADDSVDGESDSGSADGGIYLVNSFVSFTPSGQFTQQTVFKGAVYVSNMSSFDGGRYSANNKRVHVYVDRNNLLQDYSFERLSTLDKEWIVTTGTGYTAPTLSTLQAATGTKSVRFNPAAGTTSTLKKSFMIGPGGKPTACYKIRGTIPAGEQFTVTVGYAGASGFDSIISSRTFIYNYTSTGGEFNSTSWTTESVRPYSRAPKGASRYTLTFSCTSASGTMDVYIDDVIVEIIDNHPGVVDLTDTSINALGDVDTYSTAPTNGQALVWYSASGVWAPGTVAASGGLSAGTAATITAPWTFTNTANQFGSFNISGFDIADKYTVGNSGITFNYQSSTSTTTPMPYFRDFTIFDGKGQAGFKMVAATRTCTFYSKAQVGMFTFLNNQIAYTGPIPGSGGIEPGDGAELAINYNSTFDPATNVTGFTYFRNFAIYNGKGGQIMQINSPTYTMNINVDNFNLMSFIKLRGPNTAVNGVCTIQTTHTANRALTLPDASGQLTTTALVATQVTTAINAAAGVTPVPVSFVTTSYAMTAANCVVIMNAADTLQTVTLPAANTVSGRIFKVTNGSSTNSFTLTATSGLVQWLATRTINPSTQLDIISDGTNWFYC